MRFITVFENTYEAYGEPAFDKMYQVYKRKGALDIGNEICEAFGWRVDEQRFKVHTSLEIEAFPMDKWVEFKEKIREFMLTGETDFTRVWLRILELESFGKPEVKKED